jgi:hypothetical protein
MSTVNQGGGANDHPLDPCRLDSVADMHRPDDHEFVGILFVSPGLTQKGEVNKICHTLFLEKLGEQSIGGRKGEIHPVEPYPFGKIVRLADIEGYNPFLPLSKMADEPSPEKGFSPGNRKNP